MEKLITAVFKSPGKNPKKKVDVGKGPQESMAGSACCCLQKFLRLDVFLLLCGCLPFHGTLFDDV